MPGELLTIVGPMGSGKSTRLGMLLSQLSKVGYESHLFKHRIDTRDNTDVCVSRSGIVMPATSIETTEEIDHRILLDDAPRVIAFEEGQFFGTEMVEFVKRMRVETRHKLVITGLNMDFRGEPFGIMPVLMALSDDVEHLKCACDLCRSPATRTQRLIGGKPATADSPLILIGGDESYTARCPQCYVPPT